MNDDAALLRQYVDDGSETAFAELVNRYVGLVYGAALRRTGGDPHQAADVAQQVFTSLARHARALTTHPALGAWLHRATRNATLNLMKAEQRRRARDTLAALDAADNAPEPQPAWEDLRPILDVAIDELSELDRTAVVLRFLHHSGYAQIAAALRVTEDAARMRTERALEKLRCCLARRGITSTSAALGIAMSHHAFGAAPGGLAGSITTAALSAAPLGTASFASLLLMSKVTAPAISGAVAAALTAVVWTSFAPGVTAEELLALRTENQRLTSAATADASSEQLAAVAADYAAQAHALVRAVRQRQADQMAAAAGSANETRNASAASRVATVEKAVHRDHGLATPRDAALSFAWASDAADPEALARMIWFDPEVRAKALETMAALPPSLVREYPTPEAFYGFIMAALCLEAPPPAADLVYKMIDTVKPTEVRPGRLVYPNRHEYQQTPEGWKFVFPEVGVTRWLHVLGDSVLTRGGAN